MSKLTKRRPSRTPRLLTATTDEWIRRHFEELVDRFGGSYVLVAGNEVFPVKAGEDVAKLESEISRRVGKPIVGLPVPRREDFSSILSILGVLPP